MRYLSCKTECSGQNLSLWMCLSSPVKEEGSQHLELPIEEQEADAPFRVKISELNLPLRAMERGNGPISSMI